MAKLIIDPEVDEYDDVLELLDVLYGRAVEEDDEGEDEETVDTASSSGPAKTTAPIEGFTPRRMRAYLSNLTVDGAKALRFMAENAPTIEMDDVQKAVGGNLNPRQYAGTMSTFGHAKRVTKGVDRMPFDRHYRTYSMDERVAKMALDALDAAGL